MKNVYIVFGDNGQSYEDHQLRDVCAFLNEDAANKYAEDATAESGRIDKRHRKRLEKYFDDESGNTPFPKRPKNKYDPESGDDAWTYMVQTLRLMDAKESR